MTATAQRPRATTETTGHSGERPQSFTELRRLTAEQIEALYFKADTPTPEAFTGDYDGYLLGGRVVGVGKAFPIHAVNQPVLPWKGKVFSRSRGARGAGGNRIAVGALRTTIWPFETWVGPSRLGTGTTLHIDYDLPRNPFWLRYGIFDELRQLGPELFLGLGGLRVAGADRFIFSWAVRPVRK